MDQALLTIAFRTFLYLDDYGAALAVLRLIPKMGLKINERTYFIALRFLAQNLLRCVLGAAAFHAAFPGV